MGVPGKVDSRSSLCSLTLTPMHRSKNFKMLLYVLTVNFGNDFFFFFFLGPHRNWQGILQALSLTTKATKIYILRCGRWKHEILHLSDLEKKPQCRAKRTGIWDSGTLKGDEEIIVVLTREL